MRKLNLIIFSSGESEANGTVGELRKKLENCGYNCFCWKELFKNANDIENIALMPMLIKKIPTFDYALLIGEGHDKTTMMRNGTSIEVDSMRDNVLFEIGLCSMALGMQKVVLITDSKARLPDDLIGKHGNIAIRHIVIDRSVNSHEVSRVADEINEYILSEKAEVSPVVIGAAASTAEGYAVNFILRTAEHISDGFYDKADSEKATLRYPMSDIFFTVVLPEKYDENSPLKAKEKADELRTGVLDTARSRAIEFRFEEKCGKLHIIDYPTTLVTSYDTAKIILNMDADDSTDENAQSRFTDKELDLFEATLKNIMSRSFVLRQIEHFYSYMSEESRNQLADRTADFVEHNFNIVRDNY